MLYNTLIVGDDFHKTLFQLSPDCKKSQLHFHFLGSRSYYVKRRRHLCVYSRGLNTPLPYRREKFQDKNLCFFLNNCMVLKYLNERYLIIIGHGFSYLVLPSI